MQRWSERQLAMLRELGVQQFWPAPAEAAPVQRAGAVERAAVAIEARAVAQPGGEAGTGGGVAPSPSPGAWHSAAEAAEAAVPLASRPAASSAAGSSGAATSLGPGLAPVDAARDTMSPSVAGRTAAPPPGTARSPATLAAPVPLGPRPAGIESMDWATLRETVAGCRACGLCQGRRQTVFGVGNPSARWMLIGEAPGEQEDRQGEPFVGRAGQLLDRMLAAVGLTRAEDEAARQVYIANVIKCRPPGNRNPLPEEVAQCEPYLLRQVSLVQPRLIVAMGRFAVQSLLKSAEPIGRLRGRVHDYHGVPLVVTYHPAYLLRNPADKALAWDDLCLAREVMARGGPAG